jgi:uncharacterized membrane protein
MKQLEKFKEFFQKNLRYIVGGFLLLLGAVFMLIPFIPLGYVFLAVGAFLLTPVIPFLNKVVKYFEKKDDSGKIKEVEEKVDEVFENNSSAK